MKLQTINIEGAVCAIVPLKDYDALQDALEDAADGGGVAANRQSFGYDGGRSSKLRGCYTRNNRCGQAEGPPA